ncbi:IPT/TIG domain-containing protein, partial [bacterium]|nr:IPT/TIG domain-containing protein [bacterium]
MIFYGIGLSFQEKRTAPLRRLKVNSILTFCSFVAAFFGISSLAHSQNCESTTVAVGYRTIDYDDSRLTTSATEEKPESKLWWNDGFWWGMIWDPKRDVYRIHQFNVVSQCWLSVGPDLDDRPKSSADVLWDDLGQKLYVSSRAREKHRGDNSAYFFRYSYDAKSKSYSRDKGFPVVINDSRSEALVIAKDSAGKIWATWEEKRNIMVNRTLESDKNWGTPFVLPIQGAEATADDISSIVAFGGNKIGILWSNQAHKTVYFAVHRDGDSDTDWQQAEKALFDKKLGKVADDHMNLAVHPDGTVLAVTKTSVNDDNDPQIFLLKRDLNGEWSRHIFSLEKVNHTRPLVLVNSDNDSVYVVAKGKSDPIKIYMKRTHLGKPKFEPGLGETFIFSKQDDNINDPTSTKQALNSQTGLLVIASDKSSQRYFHNFLDLKGDVPIISSFTPEEGVVGTEVTVSGGNFSSVSELKFNGHSATFAVDSGSRIRAVVPDGASTGKLRMTNSEGSSSSNRKFKVILAPEITSFSPSDGSVGDEITISGNHFVQVSEVTFDGVQADGFIIDSDDQIRAEIPAGANTGPLAVSNPAGIGTSDSDLKVNFFPLISSFSPETGIVGMIVTITGSNLSSTTDVAFGEISAEFEIDSDTRLKAKVPVSASSGKIRVINSDGQTESDENFGVILPPVISSVSPDTGYVGLEITVAGSHFVEVTDVRFGEIPATTFTVDSESRLRAQVPLNASTGTIRVANPAGESLSSEDLIIIHPPLIQAFEPTDDAYVWSADPNDNFGSSNVLRVRETNSSEWRAFLKFSLTGLGSLVRRATLRLKAASTSVDGGSIHSVGNSYTGTTEPWIENGIKWSNAPEIDGTALSSLAKVTSGEIVEFDVTPSIQGDGIYSFAIENNSSDVAYYQSKEGKVVPVLIVESSTAPKPLISSFAPSAGPLGSEITVNGSNFVDITEVSFQGASTTNFFLDSSERLRVTVPSGAQSGKIRVSGDQGFDDSLLDFTVIELPVLAAFAPESGPAGAQVTVTGSNLSHVDLVSIGGISASSFSIVSNNEIRVDVPADASSGRISVTNPAGTAESSSNFEVIKPPGVTSFTPQSGIVGVEVTLSGVNLGAVKELSFGGVASSEFNIESDSELRAKVPDGGKTGKITVVNAAGSRQTDSNFIVIQAPVISSLEPKAAIAGTNLIITGSGLTGVTEVSFNGTLAPDFTVETDTKIKVMVPSGATTGKIRLTNQAATGQSQSEFVVINAPILTSFTPRSGSVGSEITINGSDLSYVTEIAVNKTPVTDIQLDSGSQLRITVPQGASTGPISVTNAAATVKSDSSFVVLTLPAISSFTPARGPVGTEVTVTGSHLHDIEEALLGDTSTQNFTIHSDTEMRIVVPANAQSGKIKVGNGVGMVESNSDFIVIEPPVLGSFVPASATVSTEVTISGINIASVTEVYFNGTLASDFHVESETEIRVQVPNGASTGKISVKNAAGAVESQADFVVFVIPAISSFKPTSGPVGVEVTLIGSNLQTATGVTFGDTPAIDFTIDSHSQMRVTVPSGASTAKIQVTNLVGAEQTDSAFVVIVAATVDSFSPRSGPLGTEVTIAGSNLASVTEIAFNGKIASDFDIDSDVQIKVRVPLGATTGKIRLKNPVGNMHSDLDYTVLEAPVINSFAPASGPVGAEVTLTGADGEYQICAIAKDGFGKSLPEGSKCVDVIKDANPPEV